MDNREKILKIKKFEYASLDISDIKYSCYVKYINKHKITVGLIKFTGKYKYGSAGADDATFIKWKINEFCDSAYPFPVHSLLIDLTDLDYEWGDDLDINPQRLSEHNFPFLIIINEKHRESYEGVLDRHKLRTDFSESIDEIIELAKRIK